MMTASPFRDMTMSAITWLKLRVLVRRRWLNRSRDRNAVCRCVSGFDGEREGAHVSIAAAGRNGWIWPPTVDLEKRATSRIASLGVTLSQWDGQSSPRTTALDATRESDCVSSQPFVNVRDQRQDARLLYVAAIMRRLRTRSHAPRAQSSRARQFPFIARSIALKNTRSGAL